MFSCVPPASELEYAWKRITVNFSNYSAWHYRTILLPQVTAAENAGADAAESNAKAHLLPATTLQKELDLLRQAVFTEPDDQSPWFYRRWVLGQAQRHFSEGSRDSDAVAALLREDIASLRELSSVEPNCKWPLLGITQALEALAVYGDAKMSDDAGEIAQLYVRLAAMDGKHGGFYCFCAAKQQAGAGNTTS